MRRSRGGLKGRRDATLRSRWWSLLALCSTAAGCGEADRPPPLADAAFGAEGKPWERAGEGHLGAESDVGLVGGACNTVTAELLLQRPNLYFLLDGSASMGEPIRAVGASTSRYQALTQAVEHLLLQVGPRVNYGVTVFPSGSMGCDAGRQLLPLTKGELHSVAPGSPSPALSGLLEALGSFVPDGATPTAAALSEVRSHLSAAAGRKYLFLVTDGAPNCNPRADCTPSSCMPNVEGWVLQTGQVCGPQLDCCAPELGGPLLCLDDEGSLAAVQALADDGVTTLVIGIPGSERYADTLNRLAEAGGAPAPIEAPSAYFSVEDAAQLASTIAELGKQASLPCTLTLAERAADRRLVNVYADGTPLAGGSAGDWVWRDEDTLEIVGRTCQRLEQGDIQKLQVITGCPVIR